MKIQSYSESFWEEDKELIETEIIEKDKAHLSNILHLSTHLLIVNDKNEILCRKRADTELRYTGQWTSTLGTHVELDFNYKSTLEKFLPIDMEIKWLGEFRVKDGFENEICGLYIAYLNEKMLPKDFMENRKFLNTGELEKHILDNIATPHLKEAYELLGDINE
jgi:isopentenyldiphosphate isomerase